MTSGNPCIVRVIRCHAVRCRLTRSAAAAMLATPKIAPTRTPACVASAPGPRCVMLGDGIYEGGGSWRVSKPAGTCAGAIRSHACAAIRLMIGLRLPAVRENAAHRRGCRMAGYGASTPGAVLPADQATARRSPQCPRAAERRGLRFGFSCRSPRQTLGCHSQLRSTGVAVPVVR